MKTVALTSGTWTQQYSIPERWDEVPSRLLTRALRCAMSGRDPESIKISMLSLFGISQDMLFRMPPASVHALGKCMAWMYEPSPVMPFKDIVHKGIKCTLPGHSFEHGTCLEWALAEEYYEGATKGDEQSIQLLCATLLRPTPARRTPIIDRNDIAAHAAALHPLPAEIVVATVLYMAGVKKSVHDTYNEWLFKKPANEEDEAPSSGPDFGWWGTYLSVAEGGVFGDYEKVLGTNFHTMCVYLVQKKKEADEARRRQKPNAIAL